MPSLIHRIAAVILFLLCVPATEAEIVDQVTAVVEEEVITLSDIQWLVRYKGFQVPEDPQNKRDFYLTVLNQVIDQRLIARQAQQTPGIHVSDEEVEAQLRAYRRRFESEAEWEDKLQSMQMTLQDLRSLIRRELTVWEFVQIRFEPFIIVLPQQIQRYYEEELVPRLKEGDSPIPPLELVEEQIREILTLERTNQEMDRWVRNAREKAEVTVLLGDSSRAPNLPQEFLQDVEFQPINTP